MATITRDSMAKKLADRYEGVTQSEARDEISWIFDTLTNSIIKGDEVRIHGFGAFRTSKRAARVGRNPRTGETVKVAARRVVRFTPSTTMSAVLKGTSSRAKKKTGAKA